MDAAVVSVHEIEMYPLRSSGYWVWRCNCACRSFQVHVGYRAALDAVCGHANACRCA